jgi:carbon-monoxide dehydrogenase small subunit
MARAERGRRARTPLVHLLREQLDLAGTHAGCDTSHRGACTVLTDGKAVKAASFSTAKGRGGQGHHHRGALNGSALHPLQQAFWEKHGLQCDSAPRASS